MFAEKGTYTFDRVVRLAITAGLLTGMIWLLGLLSDVLIPFVVALLLAYLINPLVLLIQKKIPHRGAAVFISLTSLLLITTVLICLIIPMVINELTHMGKMLSELVNNSAWTERAVNILPPDLWLTIQDYAGRKDIQDFFMTNNTWKILATAAQKILPGTWGIIAGTASFILGLVGLIVIGLYLVFLLMDYQNVSQSWQGLLPPHYKKPITTFVSDFDAAMNRYFRAQAMVASTVGILFAIGFVLIGLPMGILLGLFIGLLNMVPYLQLLGLLPAFLLALIHALETGGNFWMILGFTLSVFAVVQIIQDTILVPKIMGKVTGLSPAIILLSLSIWGKLLGLFGLIIALPMTCLLLTYYKNIISTADEKA